MRPLPQDMLDYATQDTMYLLPLRDRLAEALEGAGRTAWAREEFDRLEGTRWEHDASADAYQRIKGARDLSRRELAVLRELVAWRDGVARELDRATFRVAGNETLLELSRATPRTVDALREIRGMPRGVIERRGADVLDAIARGVAVPDEDLPRFPRAARWERDPDFDARVNRLRSIRETAAQRLDLDPGFLISRERLETIARKRPTSLEELAQADDLRQWQIDVMGKDLLRALDG
jgi:ribonuclease D